MNLFETHHKGSSQLGVECKMPWLLIFDSIQGLKGQLVTSDLIPISSLSLFAIDQIYYIWASFVQVQDKIRGNDKTCLNKTECRVCASINYYSVIVYGASG